MMKKETLPIPVQRALRKLGAELNEARRRRRIPRSLLAERTGLSISTLQNIEKGSPQVSLGGYASVLFALGFIERLGDLADASHDLTGRELANEALPERIYLNRKPRGKGHAE